MWRTRQIVVRRFVFLPELPIELEVDFSLSGFVDLALCHGDDVKDFALLDFHVDSLGDLGSFEEGGRVQTRRRGAVFLFESEEIPRNLNHSG